MKKVIAGIAICILLVPLALGAVLGISYYNTGEENVPQATLQANNEMLAPVSYSWNAPVFDGILFKTFERGPAQATPHLGTLTQGVLALGYPEGYAVTVTLLQNNEALWSGSGQEWNDYSIADNGSYQLDVVCEKAQQTPRQPYGWFRFSFTFVLDIAPVLETSGQTVKQGDVLALQVSNLQDGVLPTLQTDIPNITAFAFTPSGAGEAVAFVPVSFYCEAGEYNVHVQAGAHTWDITFTAAVVDFPRQDLSIDVSDPAISAATSNEATQQFNNAILPLYEMLDEEKLWEGNFIWPAKGRITTEYGFRRYTNGSPSSRPHAGMDIANDEGTQILAPAAGRVLYAGFLLATGNTIVVEHGGGFKTFYYHMSALHVQAGALVQQGDLMGEMGTTGYSTGSHLHFEARVANQPINVGLLLDGSSSLFHFETN